MQRVYISLAIVVLIVGGYFFFTREKSQPTEQDSMAQTQTSTTTDAITTATPSNTNSTVTSTNKIMIATIQTNLGNITLELLSTQAPNTVANFVKLAGAGFYDGTKFHRVIKGFMIQGGDPLSKDDSQKDRWGTGGPGYTFADELGSTNHNITGTIAMANAGPDTNGSQFFISTVDNNFLDGKHTVFGKVTSGMDIVHKIENVATEGPDRPVMGVVVQSITISSQ